MEEPWSITSCNKCCPLTRTCHDFLYMYLSPYLTQPPKPCKTLAGTNPTLRTTPPPLYFKIIRSLALLGFLSGSLLTACQKPPLETVYIESIPNGAKLFIDNTFIGITPLYTKLQKERTYQLDLKKIYFYRYRIQQPLNSSNTFSLIPRKKTLTLEISPQPSSLILNNQKLIPAKNKKTYTYTSDFLYGTSTLSAFKAGFPLLEKTFAVDAMTPQHLSFKFKPLPYSTRIVLKSTPEKSVVFYQAHRLGETPLTLTNLPSRTHRLRFEKPTYESQTVTFTLHRYETKTVTVTLKKPAPSSRVSFSDLPPDTTLTLSQLRTLDDKPCDNCFQTTLTFTPPPVIETNSSIESSTPPIPLTFTTNLVPGAYKYEVHAPEAYPQTGTFFLAPNTTHKEPIHLLNRFKTHLTPQKKYALSNFTVTGAFWSNQTLYLVEKQNPNIFTYTLTNAPHQPTQKPALKQQTLKEITTPTLTRILAAMISGNGYALHPSIETVSYALAHGPNAITKQLYLFDNSRYQITQLDPNLNVKSQVSLLNCLRLSASAPVSMLPLITGQAIAFFHHTSFELQKQNTHTAIIVTDLANETTTELVWDNLIKDNGGIINCHPFILDRAAIPLRGRGIAALTHSNPNKNIELIWIAEDRGPHINVYTRTGTFLETLTLLTDTPQPSTTSPKNHFFSRFNFLFSTQPTTKNIISTLPHSKDILYLFIPNEHTLIALIRRSPQTPAHSKAQLPIHQDSLYVYSLSPR